MVFVRLLQRLGIDRDTDLVVLHFNLSRWVVAKMREMGMTPVEVPPLVPMKNRYYRHCLTKLRIFQLVQYERVVYVDADSIPLRSLNDLILLPLQGPIAAPTAYWLPQPFWTSALMVVRPSMENWRRIIRHFDRAAKTSMYDMDILNAEFRLEIQSLRSGIFSLDSEWEHIDRPNFFGNPKEAYDNVSVVHFSSIGKPWSYSTRRVSRYRPSAHPIFLEMWDTWRSTRKEICHGFVVRDLMERCRSALQR